MPVSIIAVLVIANIGIIYVLMAMPLGTRTISLSRRVGASRRKLWDALWPLGGEAGWSGMLTAAEPAGDGTNEALISLSREGRGGMPIKRRAAFDEIDAEKHFVLRFTDDNTLDPGFWKNYREEVWLEDDGEATKVTLSRKDRYRGLAFLVFRYFALRREITKLKRWAETGIYRRGGIFEHPLTQLGFAAISALVLWPLFGMTRTGLVLAVILTSVVALHEFGHMAAFRLAGHRSARMIFIPLLGGIAIGGRPYDNRFEVAFVALMGAGFSAFLVPCGLILGAWLQDSGHGQASTFFFMLVGCTALFNIANLVPIWKFDGGQVLRQICPNSIALALASFSLLSLFLLFAHFAGFSTGMLLVAAMVFAVLSLATAGIGVSSRYELKPIVPIEKLAIAAAMLSVFFIHGWGLVLAVEKLA